MPKTARKPARRLRTDLPCYILVASNAANTYKRYSYVYSSKDKNKSWEALRAKYAVVVVYQVTCRRMLLGAKSVKNLKG
jgi:hypothetical protein